VGVGRNDETVWLASQLGWSSRRGAEKREGKWSLLVARPLYLLTLTSALIESTTILASKPLLYSQTMTMMRIVFLGTLLLLFLVSTVSAQPDVLVNTTVPGDGTANNETEQAEDSIAPATPDAASDSPSDVPSMAPVDDGTGTPPGSLEGSPSMSPVMSPTLLPTAGDGSTCDICGPGREVGAPDKGIIFEGQSITCAQLQEFGQTGLIPIDVCVSVISVFETQDPCACQDEGSEPGGPAPTPTVPPTSSANTSFMSSPRSFVAFSSMVAASTITSLLLLN
jgi:hypothetical protein